MDAFVGLFGLALDIAWLIIVVHVIMSWLLQFQVLNLHQEFVANVWEMLCSILEPIYNKIRQFAPPIGGLDVAPLILILAIWAARTFLT